MEIDRKFDDESGSTSTSPKLPLDDPLRNIDAEFGGTEERQRVEKKFIRKLDARMSILVLIYVLNFIDKNSAAAARLRGFEASLHLEGQQFATVLSVLFAGYMLMQVPSNMFLNYIGKPSLYLPAAAFVWGAICCLTGVTHNFVGAVLARFFLGFAEAAFFPGAMFLLSKWYKRDELGLRTAILFTGNISSTAFGGLIAAGILDGMEGKLGHAAWRWLFFIEGGLTMVVAVIAVFILPDFPSTSRWLSPAEKRLAEIRMAEDAGGETDHDMANEKPLNGLLLAVKDQKVWLFALASIALGVGVSYAQYFPTLTATLGYSRTVSLLLCAPPWALAAILAFFIARHSDKTGERFYHVTALILVGLVGFVIAESTANVAARYVSLFLMALSYTCYVVLYTWCSNSLPRPPAKRAVGLALVNSFTQAGSLAGAYVWPSEWGPAYHKSYVICIACYVTGIAACFAIRMHLIALNKKLDKGELVEGTQGREDAMEEAAKLEGVSMEEIRARRKGFRYLY